MESYDSVRSRGRVWRNYIERSVNCSCYRTVKLLESSMDLAVMC